MSTILLLVIALIAPWVVHLAAPKQRPLALVGVVAVFLLYGIFAENPLLRWEMWAGLAAGILTVVFLAGGAVAGRNTGSIFIENGRFHGEKIIEVVAERLAQPV